LALDLSPRFFNDRRDPVQDAVKEMAEPDRLAFPFETDMAQPSFQSHSPIKGKPRGENRVRTLSTERSMWS